LGIKEDFFVFPELLGLDTFGSLLFRPIFPIWRVCISLVLPLVTSGAEFARGIGSQDDDLFSFLDVDSIVRGLVEGRATNLKKLIKWLYIVDLFEVAERLPLLPGEFFVMQYHNRRRVQQIVCSKRHHEVLDVLDHPTDDDVVLCKL